MIQKGLILLTVLFSLSAELSAMSLGRKTLCRANRVASKSARLRFMPAAFFHKKTHCEPVDFPHKDPNKTLPWFCEPDHKPPVMKTNFGNILQMDSFYENRKPDKRACLNEALQHGNIQEIATYLPYADDWMLDGSTPLLAILKHFKDPATQKVVLAMHLNAGANPMKQNLLTGEIPWLQSEHIRALTGLGGMHEDAAQRDFQYRFMLMPVKELSELMLKGDQKDIVSWCIEKYKIYTMVVERVFLPQSDNLWQDSQATRIAAMERLLSHIHNAVAYDYALLGSLLDPDFTNKEVVAFNAEILADLGYIERKDNELPDMEQAHKIAKKLSHQVAITQGKLLAALIRHPDIYMSKEQLRGIRYYLTKNFSKPPMPAFATPHSHLIANYLVEEALIEALKGRE